MVNEEEIPLYDDVSPYFTWKKADSEIAKELLKYESTPQAILRFAEISDQLSDYAYWFFLSTLWVSYSEKSNLELWKRLFKSDRPKRRQSIMKPSEFAEYIKLPDSFKAHRAHRPHETDWISYTLDLEVAERFARDRSAKSIRTYLIRKKDIVALFLRRGEQEVILVNPEKAKILSKA